MKKLSVILSMFLILAISSNIYASSILETGNWRETGELSNGIHYGIRSMTKEEKAAFQLREAEESDIKEVSEELDLFDMESDEWRETGELSNGIRYGIRAMTEEEKAAFQLREASESGIITPFSYSWSGNVNVPISNSTGTNGKQLGNNFITAPDLHVAVGVGSLPSTMPTVNIGAEFTNGMDSDWEPNMGAYEIVVFNPGPYNNYEMAIKVSTFESASASARFEITTGDYIQ
ncbi:hypothetical protein ACTNDY_01100 [Tissierellaceae bacterium HCP3S3_D8]